MSAPLMVDGDQLLIHDSAFSEVSSRVVNTFSHSLSDKMKDGTSDIIYMPYIPVQRIVTQEELIAEKKRERAGKKYAHVKISNSNSHYRCKNGVVCAEDVDEVTGKKMFLVEIETVNTCSKSGFMTLLGVCSKSGYSKIWFDEDEVEIYEYDANGDEVLKSNE